MEVHPFILSETCPLYMLIRLNTILMGSPILGAELIGRVRYIQTLRAICAVVAFASLGRALNRTIRVAPSPIRKHALIVQAALLLDQVIALRGDVPAAAVACPRGTTFEAMRQHLIQYLSCYLHRLTSCLFDGPNPLIWCIERAKRRGHVDQSFWDILSILVPSIPFRKPPVVREYVDLSWEHCGGGDGQALYELFSSQCSISCM
ncbi:hypothetical protein CC86DRAFT_20837 [Ophiobolus disseminans]|uniref:Uncharacterized protein n=1 Tax=Ophiobolus disseminans TaxID=1469910 RepID=A0A6A7A0E3_9PLEO|nr:hypothetical protein CC86DRAFT_20837 [Ophiobolus disseminans]